MAKRKKSRNKNLAAIGALTAGSLTLGVGADVVQRTGGNPGGLATASSFLPVMGSAVGAGMVVGQLRKLNKKRRRK